MKTRLRELQLKSIHYRKRGAGPAILNGSEMPVSPTAGRSIMPFKDLKVNSAFPCEHKIVKVNRRG